jgi:hypothetical protein
VRALHHRRGGLVQEEPGEETHHVSLRHTRQHTQRRPGTHNNPRNTPRQPWTHTNPRPIPTLDTHTQRQP